MYCTVLHSTILYFPARQKHLEQVPAVVLRPADREAEEQGAATIYI